MKPLFKKTLSIFLAVLCFGGMLAAAADAPQFQTNNDTVYERTGHIILPPDEGVTRIDGQIPPQGASNEYVVTIPAGGTVTLPEWGPIITKGTIIDVRAMDTTPDGATFTLSLQCSKGCGFTYGITEEQTRRMTAPASGDYHLTFTATKAVTAKIKIVTDPK